MLITECGRLVLAAHAISAFVMLGNLAAQAAALSHAQVDVLCPVTRAAQRPTNARNAE